MTTPQYIACLDYGSKRVGVAIAHTIAKMPRPLVTLPNDDKLLDAIRELVEREDVGKVLVGLPRGMDGGYTEQTRLAEAFANGLAQNLTVSVETADETLSSMDAESYLADRAHGKGDIDAMAAAVILERYLADHSRKGAKGDI